jgi:NADH-quinone oxidoreductase subunit E
VTRIEIEGSFNHKIRDRDGMSWKPTPQTEEKLSRILLAYPDRRAACLPALYLAQDELGWVPDEAIEWVSEKLDMSKSMVEGVATFYTMFNKEKVGKHHLELCTNISCSLCGAEQVLEAFEKELGIEAGRTTKDGMFTLTEVECLATCGMGPAMQVGDRIYEGITPGKVSEIIRELKEKG